MSNNKKLFFILTLMAIGSENQTNWFSNLFNSKSETKKPAEKESPALESKKKSNLSDKLYEDAYNITKDIDTYGIAKNLLVNYFNNYNSSTGSLKSEKDSKYLPKKQSTVSVDGFDKFSRSKGTFNPEENEITGLYSKKDPKTKLLFVDIKTKIVKKGTNFSKTLNGLPLIATSARKSDSSIVLYYGTSSKTSDDTLEEEDNDTNNNEDNVIPPKKPTKHEKPSLSSTSLTKFYQVDGFDKVVKGKKGLFNPNKDEIIFNDETTGNSITFMNIETKETCDSCRWDLTYHNKTLVASKTAAASTSKTIGGGKVTLYYGTLKNTIATDKKVKKVTDIEEESNYEKNN
ncbi:hypothetical protein HYV11_02370 [Candidatus Dependentiae bacterium]|nr:hypothetical protein [Candidatus Dependentiae bacterium]